MILSEVVLGSCFYILKQAELDCKQKTVKQTIIYVTSMLNIHRCNNTHRCHSQTFLTFFFNKMAD